VAAFVVPVTLMLLLAELGCVPWAWQPLQVVAVEPTSAGVWHPAHWAPK
jgi:hypothetical protein